MDKFVRLTGIAAPMPINNIDTDMIIPKQYLKTVEREGLGVGLFREHRFDEAGKEKPGFILNREPWRQAKMIVSRENFACGSSREHAAWALNDFGIRAVIAISFGDIFFNNCFQNGMLPVRLKPEEVDQVMAAAEAGDPVTIDLESQTVSIPQSEKNRHGATFKFEIDAFRKRCLLNGLDDIGITLEQEARIKAFETAHRARHAWA
jgi:3-isopropylmalate/(R)-2-methylmalate dehydratase small subunit